MRLIFGLALLVGLALAGFAVHTAQSRFQQYQSALAATKESIIETKSVFVVRQPLKYGDELRPMHVVEVEWPASHMPTGTFASMEEIFPADGGPRTVLRRIERNEPLLASKVTEPGQEAGLAATLTPGMRAFTLSVDVNSGVSGFLRPGDRVDIYWTGGGGGGSDGGVTKLIEANVQLIAIDQQTDEQRNDPTIARNVTIEALPPVVAKLVQAQATGRLTLTLVGVQDESESQPAEATLREVLGAGEQVANKVCTTRQRRGAEVVLVPIPCPDEG
ncbi:Flp pilus assembly protein CpaB [Jannaschia seohaensis]|uniref:Pilus assembly protein CpaB n=1 Tax=Jannaschia seohaensis TaxID=475081 RepID=A0A2Y9C2K2_9RHOB|nr:Flp pilus assembly protein CpaB [Jannaschia seohaensis]PWJ15013.1 pilus assembly protein CpaB [Jannaschia seohaensis]SSA49862.1 pilus assembly protein CpaB [Jannaschia seohaensis]